MKKLLFVAVLLTAGFVGQSFASAQPAIVWYAFQTALQNLVKEANTQYSNMMFSEFIAALNAPTGNVATFLNRLLVAANPLGITTVSSLIPLLENLANLGVDMPLVAKSGNNYLDQISGSNWSLSKWLPNASK